MAKKRLNVYIGPVDVGNWGLLLRNSLRASGHRARLIFGFVPPARRDYAVCDSYLALDRRGSVFGVLLRLYAIVRTLVAANVVIFPAGTTWLTGVGRGCRWLVAAELFLYRLFGVRIVGLFVGCDLRHFQPAEVFARGVGSEKWHGCQFCPQRPGCSYLRKQRLADDFERYSHLIYAHSEGRFFFRRRPIPVTLLFDLTRVQFKVPSYPPIRIVHAPSNKGKKGTERIMAVLSRIEETYGERVSVRLLHELPNSQVLNILEESHILINQIAFYDISLAGLEGMAAGCVVMSSTLLTNDEVPEFAGDCPIEFVDFSTLEQKLAWYIERPDKIHAVAAAGRRYVEKYNDFHRVSADMMRSIEQLF